MTAGLNFIHQFIPGSSDRTLLLLHGTGGDESQLLGLGRELDPTAALLSPRGPVSENGHLRFFRRFAEGVFDLEDLERRTDDLAEFIGAAAAHYRLAPEKIVAVGYSNGANIAASILLRRPGSCGPRSCFGRWCRCGRKRCRTSPASGSGSAAENTTRSFRRKRPSNSPSCSAWAGAEVTARFFDADHSLTNTEFVVVQRWLAALAA